MARGKRKVKDEVTDDQEKIIDEKIVEEKTMIPETTEHQDLIDEKIVDDKEKVIDEKIVEEKTMIPETTEQTAIVIEDMGYQDVNRDLGIKAPGDVIKRTVSYPDGRVRSTFETLRIRKGPRK